MGKWIVDGSWKEKETGANALVVVVVRQFYSHDTLCAFC